MAESKSDQRYPLTAYNYRVTIAGTAMFALCDVALYVAILGEAGRVAHAVTANVSINFLRKPAPADLIGKARLIKLGRRLAVGEVPMPW